ncbi:MAG: FAD-binding oxidoreductase [Gammaproteobacteria bacterium]|nr:FAD-binding oxidoreductase [Gammaproteobacteria bacterium]
MNEYDNGSFWFDSLPDADWRAPPVNDLPESVDIAIIGGGFTGLWSAYYLARLDPSLSVAVFEADVCGFGASGRNGGWCMGAAFGVHEMLAIDEQRERGLALQRALFDTLAEIRAVTERENIDCHFQQGGTLTVASTEFAARRGRRRVDGLHDCGFGDADYQWLEAEQARRMLNCESNYGAVFSAHTAAIHPARLVRSLKEVVERAGVCVLERTPVREYVRGELVTTRGPVRVRLILRCTEGYSDSIAGQRRQLAQLYSSVIATEPLPAAMWDEIGLSNRETFGDTRRVTIYGQRTFDDRLVFGARAFYYFAGRRLRRLPTRHRSVADTVAALHQLLPITRDIGVTHRWGGLMGVPRHLRPCVVFDRDKQAGWAGGYTGEGVGASNLAARILVDLALERRTELTELAWVNDVPPRWEPEPLRWLALRGLEFVGHRADAEELASGQRSRVYGQLFDRFFS